MGRGASTCHPDSWGGRWGTQGPSSATRPAQTIQDPVSKRWNNNDDSNNNGIKEPTSINYHVLQRATKSLTWRERWITACNAGWTVSRKKAQFQLPVDSSDALLSQHSRQIYFCDRLKILRNISWNKKVYNICTPLKINNKANTTHFIKEITVSM